MTIWIILYFINMSEKISILNNKKHIFYKGKDISSGQYYYQILLNNNFILRNKLIFLKWKPNIFMNRIENSYGFLKLRLFCTHMQNQNLSFFSTRLWTRYPPPIRSMDTKKEPVIIPALSCEDLFFGWSGRVVLRPTQLDNQFVDLVADLGGVFSDGPGFPNPGPILKAGFTSRLLNFPPGII